ncbi:MAG: helix-turn-helix domain-containing protein [Cytophagales bacterium]|nr:helix-turn-helix domain-containing protein [Cytophagales bacterium]
MDAVLTEIQELKKMIQEQSMLQKEVLNFHEATAYLELSQSHLYKMTSSGEIPFYKPNGKKLYFKRTELDQWLLRNRNTTSDELLEQTATHLAKKGRKQ